MAMSKLKSTLGLMMPMVLLAGCGAGPGTMNRGLEPVHQPVVTHSNYLLDLNTDGTSLVSGERNRLAGWLGSLRLGYGDRVAFDDPAGASGARAEVASVVADYGLFLEDQAPVTAGRIGPGMVRIVVMRSVAAVPGCPDYSRNPTPNYKNSTSSNYGCAVNSNIAAMVARPDDLVRGQPGTISADPAVSAKAIQTFRKAPNTGAGGLKSEGVGK